MRLLFQIPLIFSVCLLLTGCVEYLAAELAVGVATEVAKNINSSKRKTTSTKRSNTEIDLAQLNSMELGDITGGTLCKAAVEEVNAKFYWVISGQKKKFADEAKRRGLTCGVKGVSLTQTASASSIQTSTQTVPPSKRMVNFQKSTLARLNNIEICLFATDDGDWIKGSENQKFVREAKERNLDCGVGLDLAQLNLMQLGDITGGTLCKAAVVEVDSKLNWVTSGSKKKFAEEAKRRGLTCGVKSDVTNIANSTSAEALIDPSSTVGIDTVFATTESQLCETATIKIQGKQFWHKKYYQNFVKEAKRRGLSCGVGGATSTQVDSTTTRSSSSISSAELTAAQRKAERLEAELAALKTEQQQEQQRIDSDTQIPLITATSRRDSETNTQIVGQVTDNVEVAEVTVDGEPVRLGSNGSFETSFYVPRSGKVVEIVAFDKKGNKATKTVRLERGAIQEAAGPIFANLNPSGKRVANNKDALALIVGVSDYERTPAKAAYADKDAQTFYDYAMLKLGIPASNIKELVNTDAGEVDVRLAVKDWVARTTKQGRSDVYVFFAGHGLADQSGKEMYLLPHDGEPRLLEDTAISRERLFADIAAANPRSVTVFLDTCYSGTTRGTDMLIASRAVRVVGKQNIPDGFTVFTAAGGDQTAKPLEEAKHGMFSYFLMKGMEGDADSNNDNQITAAELHQYVEQNVVQQSGGSQVPELQGDAGRVLVRFQ